MEMMIMKKYLTFRSVVSAFAVASFMAVSLAPVSASADGWRGHRGGYHHRHHGGGGTDWGDVGIAAVGGLLLGAIIMDAGQQRSRAAYGPPPGYYGPGNGAVDAMPTSDIYRGNDGRYCRDYESTNGGYGTACQGNDGVWRTVN